jgi:hypothetical protein
VMCQSVGLAYQSLVRIGLAPRVCGVAGLIFGIRRDRVGTTVPRRGLSRRIDAVSSGFRAISDAHAALPSRAMIWPSASSGASVCFCFRRSVDVRLKPDMEPHVPG